MAGETVGSLYVKLGLDISSLDQDFALADKSVSQAISRLNHESKKIRIGADIDLKTLDAGADSMRGLNIQQSALSRQADIQRKKIELLNAAYRESVAAKGADSAASARLETRLLNERRTLANLTAQLRNVDKERAAASKSTLARSIDQLAAGASIKQVAIGAAQDAGIGAMLSSPAFKAVGAAGAVAAGVVAAAKSAMTAGDAIYNLSIKMHTTTGEAAQMSRMFSLAGADVNSAVPAIIRLDKTLESGGESGERMTAVLSAYGVSLRDANGDLLPVNQQLIALAQGYRNAAAAGLESEYVTQTLGARGAELVPVLAEMSSIQERMSKMPSTGLADPEKAHQMMMDWRELQTEIKQVEGAVGQAVMPIVADVLPQVVDGVESITQAINDNKETIKSIGDVLGETISIAGDLAGIAGEFLPKFSDDLDGQLGLLRKVDDALKDIKQQIDEIKGSSAGGILSNVMSWLGPNFIKTGLSYLFGGDQAPDATAGADKQAAPSVGATTQDAETTRERVRAANPPRNNSTGATGKQKAPPDLTDDIYKATHSDLQNQLHDIDTRAEKLRAEGASEVDITRLREAEKARVIREFNDNTLSQLDRSFKSELQNRLDDIDREKRAWQQKGVDEVAATKWAENEKSKARNNAALSALRENKKYLQIFRDTMAGPGNLQERMNNARFNIMQAMRKEYGIENEHITPDELTNFTAALDDAKNNVAMPTAAWATIPAANSVSIIRGSTETYAAAPTVNNTVNVNGGVYTDNATMKAMARDVTNTIVQGVQNIARNPDVSYGG